LALREAPSNSIEHGHGRQSRHQLHSLDCDETHGGWFQQTGATRAKNTVHLPIKYQNRKMIEND
jgi:hypothetical protein